MPQQRRETAISISVKTRLNNLAKQSGLHPTHATQLIYLAYLQEAFLRRLARSVYVDQFILGGGSLLSRLASGYHQARPSKDLDLLCRLQQERTPNHLQQMFAAILQMPGEEDAVQFDPTVSKMEPLETAGPEGGWRVEVMAWLGHSHLALKLDVVWEPLPDIEPQHLAFPTLLNPSIALPPILTYPLEAVMADKMASMLARGPGNSRQKDYLDLWLLARSRDFEGTLLEVTLRATCAWQQTPVDPGAPIFASAEFPTQADQVQQWQRFLDRARITFPTPTFAEAIALIRRFYGPVLQGEARGKRWRHEREQWEHEHEQGR